MMRIRTNLNRNLDLKEEVVTVANGMLTVTDSDKEVFRLNTKEIEKASIEEGLGIAKLIVKCKDGSEKEVAYFTKGKVKLFSKFADAINQYAVRNKEIKTTFEDHKEKRTGISTIKWLYGFAAKHRNVLLVGVVLSLITVGLNLIPPYLLKVLIDNVLLVKSHDEALFIELTIIMLVSYAASTIVSTIQSYSLNLAGNRIVTDLRDRLFRKAVRLPAGDIDAITPSRIQTRLTSDTGNTQWLMTYGLSTVITNALTIVGIGVILFLLFPELAIFVLLPIPFIIFLVSKYNKSAEKAYHKNWRRSADLWTKINDVIPNYTIVKSATKEEFEGNDFGDSLSKFYNTVIDIQKMELSYWQPIGFLVSIATVIIFWVGGNLVLVGTIQLGIITAFLAYMGMFYSPIQQLSTLMPYLQESLTSGERLREVFDSELSGNEPHGSKKPDLDKDIKFQNMWFGYDPLFPVIKGMNATIEKGKITAIVGKSGAGKSTISKLLLGLYKINSGDIKYGDVSINNIDISYLREHVAYVPQDSTFFDNTVAYNISYFATKELSPIDMIATTKAIEMHSEVMRLPLCYDNRIRGRGLSLSGGQRQRLAVARAILGNTDVILLDEITSNLDAINARKVNSAVLRLESEKTMIFITHDINEITNADHVIVMDEGEVVEQGRPAELIRKRGKLYEMFKYKLGSRSDKKAKPKRITLQSLVKNYMVDGRRLKIAEGERRSFVDIKYNNKLIRRVTPKRPFPVSNPDFIIFYRKKDNDLFAIYDSKTLDKESKSALDKTLEVNSYNPKVTGIKNIKITGDGLEWELITDKGSMSFNTKNRSDIVTRGDFMILIDEFNTPLMIDMRNLDQKSRELVNRSV